VERERWRRLAGVFFVTLAAFYFEIFSIQLIAIALSSFFTYAVIGLAVLGNSAAGSLLTVVPVRSAGRRRDALLFALCAGLAVSVVLSYGVATAVNDARNAAFLGDLAAGRRAWFGLATTREVVLVALPMAIPHFLFGAVITVLFSTSPHEEYPRLYFADLLGGAAGCVLSFLALEYGGFGLAAALPPCLALVAGFFFLSQHVAPGRALALCGIIGAAVVGVLALAPRWFEPRPEPHVLVRSTDLGLPLEEKWHLWNSYTRVGAVEVNRRWWVLGLGKGESNATLASYDPDGRRSDGATGRLVLSLGAPRDVLVLFAGVGADMLQIERETRGQSRITGVELNRRMVERAAQMPEFRLREFYALPHVSMRTAEARAFLEEEQGQYDVILLSWSGATQVYHSGVIASTVQYMYTEEAVEALLKRLKPGGFVVVMDTNKANMLIALRRVMERRRLADPASAVVVLTTPGSPHWTNPWDDNRLVIKPDGLSDEEVERVAKAIPGATVAYAPRAPEHPAWLPYFRILRDPDLDATVAVLNEASRLRFAAASDDRPFPFDLFDPAGYATRTFWRDVFTGRDRWAQHGRVFFVLLIAGASVVLVLGPLVLVRGPAARASTPKYVAYFACLGAGFMLVEIGLMQKMGLLLGTPSLAIAIVLAALVLFAGLGSLVSGWTAQRGLHLKFLVTLLGGYVLLVTLGSEGLLRTALPLPLVVKALITAAVVAPAGLLMGQLLPQGLRLLRHDQPALVPWAWAVNGTTGTVASGLAPLIGQAMGFRAVLTIGVAVYLVILALPGLTPKREAG
jgi:SAM-dependent methyltransferase